MLKDKFKKKYSIIYADPPWQYEDSLDHIKMRGEAPKYKTLSLEELKRLRIDLWLAEKDCILFLWVTMPKLKEGLELIDAWNFTFKTVAFVWIKTYKNGSIYKGIGRWVQGNAELVLLAVKGHPHRANKHICVSQIVKTPMLGHSVKPKEIRERIDKLMGNNNKLRIELFGRGKEEDFHKEGWEVTGLECDGIDIVKIAKEKLNL